MPVVLEAILQNLHSSSCPQILIYPLRPEFIFFKQVFYKAKYLPTSVKRQCRIPQRVSNYQPAPYKKWLYNPQHLLVVVTAEICLPKDIEKPLKNPFQPPILLNREEEVVYGHSSNVISRFPPLPPCPVEYRVIHALSEENIPWVKVTVYLAETVIHPFYLPSPSDTTLFYLLKQFLSDELISCPVIVNKPHDALAMTYEIPYPPCIEMRCIYLNLMNGDKLFSKRLSPRFIGMFERPGFQQPLKVLVIALTLSKFSDDKEFLSLTCRYDITFMCKCPDIYRPYMPRQTVE